MVRGMTKIIEESDVIYQESVPKHVVMRLKACPDAAICVQSQAPYAIVAANQAWQDQCGYGKEAIGQSPKILQGDRTDQGKATRFASECATKGECRMTLINYKKNGTPFVHKIHAEAIKGSSFFLSESVALPDSPVRQAVMKNVAMPLTGIKENEGILSTAKQALSVAIALTVSIMMIIALSMNVGGTDWVVEIEPSLYRSWSGTVSAKAASTFTATSSSPEVIPMAFFFLLSFLVAATKEATNPSKASTTTQDAAVAASLVVTLACIVVDGATTIPGAVPVVRPPERSCYLKLCANTLLQDSTPSANVVYYRYISPAGCRTDVAWPPRARPTGYGIASLAAYLWRGSPCT